MVSHSIKRETYTLGPRVIAGTREQKLEQIDDEIQQLLKIKSLECEDSNSTYLAAPQKSHWFAMTVTILVLLIGLVLLLMIGAARAQTKPPPFRTTATAGRSSAVCGSSATNQVSGNGEKRWCS